jgi:hypothetical protein
MNDPLKNVKASKEPKTPIDLKDPLKNVRAVHEPTYRLAEPLVNVVKSNLQIAIGGKESFLFINKNSQTFALISISDSIYHQSSSEQTEISKLRKETIKICEEYNKTHNTKKFQNSVEKFQSIHFKDYNINKDLIQFSDFLFMSIPFLILTSFLFVKKNFVTSLEKTRLKEDDRTKFNLKISQTTIKTAFNTFLIAVIVVLSMNSTKLNDVKQKSITNFKNTVLGHTENIETWMPSYFNDEESVIISQLENVKFKHKQDWKGFAVEDASSFKFVYYHIIGLLFLNDISMVFILFAIIFGFILIRKFIKKNVNIEIV